MQTLEKRNKNGQTLEEFLSCYDPSRYQRPSVTADIAVFGAQEDVTGALKLCVLLVERANHPFIGQWALPGGFVNMDEDLDAAAARELYEETGLSHLHLRQFGAFGAVNRDPRTRVITVAHYAVARIGTLQPSAGDDAANAEPFCIDLKLIAQSASADVFRMTLSNASRTLTANVKRGFDSLGFKPLAMSGGDLAADHAHILFSALCALQTQPRTRIATLLAGHDHQLYAKSMQVLDALFAQLRCIVR